MKVACPNCAKYLAIPDEFAGRRVKCPACQEAFQIPASTAVASSPPAKPAPAPAAVAASLPAKKPAAPAPSEAVQKTTTPAKRAGTTCPECGETLDAGETECPECGWKSDRRGSKAPRRAPAADGMGGCYIFIRRDEVDLTRAIEKRMEKLIETEQLDIQLMDEEDRPPDELGPDDVVISGKIDVCEYGSRAMRYFLTFVSMFGPGSCQLDVAAEAETAEGGVRRIRGRSRLWAGIFGGSSNGMMKRNIQIVSSHIARNTARHVTGNRFLNVQAYNGALWSLGLGIASLIPFIGVLFGLIGFIVGLVAYMTIRKRQLPRRKSIALIGMVLPFLGFAVTAGIIFLTLQK